MSGDVTESVVREQLREVLDPCSCFTETPVDIVDLGLVDAIEVDGGVVRIELLLTSPGCTYLPYIENDIEERVRMLSEVETVDVVQVTDDVWTRERMDDAVREARRNRFRERLRAEGIEPYAQQVE